MSSLLPVLLAIGGGIPVVLWAARAGRKSREAADVVWAEAARELDGAYTPRGGTWTRPTARKIVARVDDLEVVIDHHEVSNGNDSTTTHTRARVRARAAPEFTLKVSRAGALSALARAVGFQDVDVGDSAFDATFVVKSSDPVAARLWLNAAVRTAIVENIEFTWEIKAGTLVAERGTLLTTTPALVALARAAATVADGRQRVLKAWRAIATQYGGNVRPHAERWATMELTFEGAPMRVDTRKVGDDHFTYVTTAVRGARAKPFVLASDLRLPETRFPRVESEEVPDGYALFAEDADGVAGRLSPELLESLERLDVAMIRVGADKGTVTWPGVCLSRTELEDAMQLCARLTDSASATPYR